MKRKHTRGWLIALLLLGAVGLLGWRAWPRERLLLSLSTRIMSTQDFRPRAGRFTPYLWLSAHEIGYFVNDATDSHRTLMARDIVTGQTRRGRTFTIGEIAYGAAGSVSPDGKWLLWMRPRWLDHYTPVVYALDDARTISFPVVLGAEVTWMPDSRHLVSTHWGTPPSLAIFDRDNADNIATADLPGITDPNLLGITVEGRALITSGLPFYSSMLSKFVASATTVGTPALNLTEFTIGPPPGSFHTRLVYGPPQTEASSVIPSPQGDRLLWLVSAERVSPPEELLHRLFPAYKWQPRSMLLWYTCRLDGGDMHEIGHFIQKDDMPSPGDPKWSPDGKKLSFLYRDDLYTIPAE